MSRSVSSASRSLSARQRARKAQQAEYERQKQITELLADVFTALDARDAADTAAGAALNTLKEAGEPVSTIAQKTGLSVREINSLITLAAPLHPADSHPTTQADTHPTTTPTPPISPDNT